jgi:glycosyltransferase involved in cell wall biosynthesis
MRSALRTLPARVRQIRNGLRREGPAWLAHRIRHSLADRIRPQIPLSHVFTTDVLAADLTAPARSRPLPLRAATKPTVNWVMLPPSPGSGGHSTIFRILRHLEVNGFGNRVYFYDPYRSDHAYYISVVRDYFGFGGPVADIQDGMADAHAIIATSWPTAYPVFSATSAGRKFYFVQDFEPSFYPTSSNSILAENTYRMGLHGITAGSWLAGLLRRDYGMKANHFDFGCDVDHYHRDDRDAPRKGVAFYARPNATRRAFEIGIMTLELLAKRRPDVDLHLYGSPIGPLPFRFINHGLASPRELNAIYNQCFAGLTLSLTNVSLVPHEMLAAGCIPVVNDAEHNRAVLDNPHVRYAPLSPHALARAIEEIADSPDQAVRSRAAAASVRARSWDDAGQQVAEILWRAIADEAPAPRMEEREWLPSAS